MSARKPLEEGCTGDIWCKVSGHVTYRALGGGRGVTSHIRLTVGQRKTLFEQRRSIRRGS